jgi:DNA mismatch endonuclease (patch repair protein)
LPENLYAKKLADNLSREKRSKVMASIRSKNTKPEIMIRKILWSKGKRYRLHDRSIPGIPDISNKSKKVAIFIDGCFWHGCSVCYKEPRTNVDYWRNKILQNKQRRVLVVSKLQKDDWKILQFWEHQVIQDAKGIVKEISRFL